MQLFHPGLEYAEEDRESRALIEVKNDGEQLFAALMTALQTDQDLLKIDELQNLQDGIKKLQDVLPDQNTSNIRQAIKHLEHISQNFAALRIERTLKHVLKGHALGNVEKAMG